jgi:Peptidase A4 family
MIAAVECDPIKNGVVFMRGLSRLIAGAGAAVAVVALSPGLASAGPVVPGITIVSPIASGYAALPKPGGAQDFVHVQTTFNVPAVTCSAQNATAQTRAGLDGITNDTVERVGVNEACVNAVAFYTAWYQMFPAMGSPALTFHPSPGDKVTASVTAHAGVYTLSVDDLTSAKSFTVTKTCASCQDSSAEVTAGSPPGVAPANFGVVHFTNIVVADGGGVSGGLANAAWNTGKLTQPGSPHTVAGALPAPYTAFPDHWAP